MILAGVFLLSLSSLLFEVLLARFFSITQWHHFSFLVISIALFGISASGILLNLLEARGRKAASRPRARGMSPTPNLIGGCILLFSLSVLAAYLIGRELPLDTFRLAVQPAHLLYLVLTFLLFAVPFFFSGFVTALAYSFLPHRTGAIYFSAMAGSALGAVLPLALLRFLALGQAILASACVPAFFAAVYLLRNRRAARGKAAVELGLLATGAVALTLVFVPFAVRIEPSPYKALSHYRQFPDTEIVDTRETIRGRIDRVRSPYIRFAPGLSLKYRDPVPSQEVVLRDGDAPTVLYQPEGGLEFTSFMLSSGAFALRPAAENALIVQRGGGAALASAIRAGIAEITVVEEQPGVARLLEEHYTGQRWSGGTRPTVNVVVASPQVFLRRASERWDIIWIESWGASLPGMESLSEDHVLTVEMFRSLFLCLETGGLLVSARRMLMPPSDSLRLIATAAQALEALCSEADPAAPFRAADHMAVIRNYDTYALFASRDPLSPKQLTELADFVRDRNFDWIHYPGMERQEANRFNVLEEPYYYDAAQNVLGKSGSGFIREYPLDIRPQTDDRPFFNRFLRWGRLRELLQGTGRGAFSLLLTGEVLVLLLLAVAVLISFLLLFLPVAVSAGRIPFTALYFLLVGAGFMFCEIAYIQEYTFLFGDPVISFSFVLAGILVFSGIGGYLSDRFPPERLKYFLAALVVLVLVSCWAVPAAVKRLLGAPLAIRALCAALLLLPVSMLLGFPFPTAIRTFYDRPGERAFAWAANGSASVLTSIAATHVALSLGISRLFLFAGLCYLCAASFVLRAKRA